MKNNFVLIGMMGSGKTTVGKALAALCGCEFVDTDELIVKRMKMPISDIFSRYGEKYFRALEADTARQVANLYAFAPAVISTGGGIILAAENMRLLSALGAVVYLRAGAETLLARLESEVRQPPKTSRSHTSLLEKRLNDADFSAKPTQLTGFSEVAASRPLLAESVQEKMPIKIAQLLQVREKLYERCSDFVIDTDELTVEEILERITHGKKNRGNKRRKP